MIFRGPKNPMRMEIRLWSPRRNPWVHRGRWIVYRHSNSPRMMSWTGTLRLPRIWTPLMSNEWGGKEKTKSDIFYHNYTWFYYVLCRCEMFVSCSNFALAFMNRFFLKMMNDMNSTSFCCRVTWLRNMVQFGSLSSKLIAVELHLFSFLFCPFIFGFIGVSECFLIESQRGVREEENRPIWASSRLRFFFYPSPLFITISPILTIIIRIITLTARVQVSQLRVENSSLLKRLSDVSQKYNEAAVDNRVLKADVETLRAKVIINK